MIILAIDSTARACSAAIGRDGHVLVSMQNDTGNTHSEQLLPMIENCLSRASLSFADIDAFACTVGPGSFTGVRIGVSVIKGLAFGTDKPCIEVSALEAIAENLRPLGGILCPVMDARRSQVYTALFEANEQGELVRLTEDSAIALSALAEKCRPLVSADSPLYLAGDGYELALRELTALGIPCAVTPPLLRLQNAASVLAIAERKLHASDTQSDLTLSPLYLRLPQAERERLEKEREHKKTQTK